MSDFREGKWVCQVISYIVHRTFNNHVDKNLAISEIISYYCALLVKKRNKITLNLIELNSIELN